MNFDAFINEIQEHHWEVHGVEIYKNGKLLHEYGVTGKKRFPIYSATKTITSLAVGMAVDEGIMDIEKSVLCYLPETVTKELSSEQRAVFQGVTIKRLLTMSVSGFPFRPEGNNWLQSALQYPIKNVEIKAFDYSNISAYLVGVAAACALEEDLYEYLQRKLFEPLNILKPPCQRCPSGYFYGASGMSLTVHELSKIGKVLYNYGTYEGRRLVSESYVREASSVQQMNREGGYGYFIWKYKDGFSINGKWGQKCYVLPEQKMLITYLANMQEDSKLLTESMEKYIL